MLSEQEFSCYGLIRGKRLRNANTLLHLVTSLKLTPPVERHRVYRAAREQCFHLVKDFGMARFYLLLLRNETVWNFLWKEIVSAQNVLELHTLVEGSSPHGFLRGHKPCNPAAVELGGTWANSETLQPPEALHRCSTFHWCQGKSKEPP